MNRDYGIDIFFFGNSKNMGGQGKKQRKAEAVRPSSKYPHQRGHLSVSLG